MKIVLDNLILSAAIFVSVLFHTIVLMVHFVMPKAEPVPAEDPGLEIILVNAKHAKRPMLSLIHI